MPDMHRGKVNAYELNGRISTSQMQQIESLTARKLEYILWIDFIYMLLYYLSLSVIACRVKLAIEVQGHVN